jgi:hypothetical protein
MSRAAAIALMLAGSLGANAAAKKRPPASPPPAPAPKEPAAKVIDVRIAEGGQMAEVHVEGDLMHTRSTAGATRSARPLGDADRERLARAARGALASDDTRRGCGTNEETFVSVTVDGTTLGTAVCPNSPDSVAGPWRALVKVVREILSSP